MRARKHKVRLPIGRAAMIALQINLLRGECCDAARILVNRAKLDEEELDECARLDEALARAHRILRQAISGITLSRVKRRSRTT